MRSRWIVRTGIIGALVCGGGSGGPLHADALYYAVKDGRVVFTNMPGGADTLPVPGLATRVGAARRAAAALHTPYDDFIDRIAIEHDVPADLIKAVVQVESNFDPRAVSPKGAQGLMQLMPATGRRYGLRDAFDPLENLRAGSAHLRDLLDEFGGDVTLALAAYNAGSGAVRRHGGVPAYRETRNYVDRVQARMGQGARAGVSVATPAIVEPVRIERGPDGSVRLVN